MVETVTQIGAKTPGWKAGELVQLAQILLDSIPSDKKQVAAYKVMAYLAQETILRADAVDPPKFSTKAIYSDLGGNPNSEPSAWASPIWIQIQSRCYREIEETLIERCRAAGLNAYPAFEKIEGKPAYYRLSSKPIPSGNGLTPPDKSESQPNDAAEIIHYQKDLTLQLSTAGQMFFAEGMKWTLFKRYSFLTSQLLLYIAIVIYVLSVWTLLWLGHSPLSGRDVVLVALGIVFPWWAYRLFIAGWRLFEDRIIIAPDWMLSWKETGATIEMSRSKTPDAPSTIHVNRYTATCPTCGWMVKLENGEPDFPRRIVGRCEENPREHVFSFDRSTRLGLPIRVVPRYVEKT